MHSTALNWQRILVGVALGPLAGGLALQSGEGASGLGLGLLAVGFTLFAAAIVPAWSRARSSASEDDIQRGRRSFDEMPRHLKIPLGINIALNVFIGGLAVIALVAMAFTDVPLELPITFGVLSLLLAGGNLLLWRIGSRPTGARQQMERDLKRNSDTRRQLVALIFGLPLLAAWLLGSSLLGPDPSPAILAAVVAATALVGVVGQWVDTRETRRVMAEREDGSAQEGVPA